MRTDIGRTIRLGDLVVAAFDTAGRLSESPREVSLIAAKFVARALVRTQRAAPLSLPADGIQAAIAV